MAKKSKPAKTSAPRLDPGTSVSEKSLVVDIDGNAWWVDPELQTIKKVT